MRNLESSGGMGGHEMDQGEGGSMGDAPMREAARTKTGPADLEVQRVGGLWGNGNALYSAADAAQDEDPGLS